jgi:hypothetical protein
MNLAGIRHGILTSPTSRVFALAGALMLAFACLADVAHAASGAADACPQGKLESQQSPLASVDSAILPDRFEPGPAPMLARVVDPNCVITTSFVLARPAAPRAPPIA